MQKPMSRLELSESLVELGLLPTVHGQHATVLVVDDDPLAVELLAVSLSSESVSVLRAHGGQEGIATTREKRPDLIVLDLMMPDVSGFDVVEALGRYPETAQIPIVILTAKKIGAADRARLTGYVTTIMEKTEFGPDRIASEVRRALAHRRRAV